MYVDPDLVKTLPVRYVHNGLGEAVKVGCVSDKELFEIFEKASTEEEIFKKLPEIIRRCIEIKSRLVEADPADKKEDAFLTSVMLSEGRQKAITALTTRHLPTEKPRRQACT